jgi:hypothetical protein
MPHSVVHTVLSRTPRLQPRQQPIWLSTRPLCRVRKAGAAVAAELDAACLGRGQSLIRSDIILASCSATVGKPGAARGVLPLLRPLRRESPAAAGQVTVMGRRCMSPRLLESDLFGAWSSPGWL